MAPLCNGYVATVAAICFVYQWYHACAVRVLSKGIQSFSGRLEVGHYVAQNYRLLSLMSNRSWPQSDFYGGKLTKVGEGPVGKGNFGETWLAMKGNELVAVKLFYRKLPNNGQLMIGYNTANPKEKAELDREAVTCAMARSVTTDRILNFPQGKKRIANCFMFDKGSGENGNYAFLIMEVAGTKNLQNVFEKMPELHSNEYLTLRVTKMLLEGLLQMEGILVHKDIKPDNIMFDEKKYSIKYVDFGLAETVGTPKCPHESCVQYQAPELAGVAEFPCTEKLDIWALGATLYWLICGSQYYHVNTQELKRGSDAFAWCMTQPRTSKQWEVLQMVRHHMLKVDPSKRSSASELLRMPLFMAINTEDHV